MSDDLHSGDWDANLGATLPEDTSATHNIALSPLFVNRSGYKQPAEQNIMYRGLTGHLSSNNSSAKRKDTIYFFGTNALIVDPSNFQDGTWIFSLRCLVSITNS